MRVSQPSNCWFPLSIVLLALTLSVQQETGSITGQVVDPSGATLPRAEVVARNDSTAATFRTSVDEAGFYRIPQLAPGTYTITATASGFRTLVREGIFVRVNDRLRIDLGLEVGAVTEKITVETTTPLLQTEDATAGQVIENQRIVELPLNGRNWLQLATLAPATVTYPGTVDLSSGNSQNVIMNLGGNRTNQNNFLLDGADHTMFVGGGGGIVFPPVRIHGLVLEDLPRVPVIGISTGFHAHINDAAGRPSNLAKSTSRPSPWSNPPALLASRWRTPISPTGTCRPGTT